MSNSIGPIPLPTPQTLEYLASVKGSSTRGKRWRTAAFFCDLGGLLLVLAAWTSYRPGVAPTALIAGGVALLVSTVALVRSWMTTERIPAAAWVSIALTILGVAAIA